VALRPDGVRPPEELWGLETDYLMEVVDAYLPPRDATAWDFGCGPGRLAKPLIERKNWSVLGVDISPIIAAFATEYVKSEQFLVCNPNTFDQLLRFGVRADFALAIWVLQHSPRLNEDIRHRKDKGRAEAGRPASRAERLPQVRADARARVDRRRY